MDRYLRNSWVDLIEGIEPEIAVTLGAPFGLAPVTFDGKARHFLNRCQREAYGRTWAKRDVKDRIYAIGFTEHHRTNLHMHVAVRAPTRELKKALFAGEGIWREICHAGDYYAVPIRETPAQYARYMTKTFFDPACRDEPFVYSPG